MAFAFGVLLVASSARVVGAFYRGEMFGAEATLALLVVMIGIGLGVQRAVRWLRPASRDRSSN